MRSDCKDIAIVDDAGNSLPIWVSDNSCDTTKTYIWTMIPIIKPGINTISAYYGDSSYQYSSNGHDVFPVYFEDYNNVTLTDIISGGTQSTVPSSRVFLVTWL